MPYFRMCDFSTNDYNQENLEVCLSSLSALRLVIKVLDHLQVQRRSRSCPIHIGYPHFKWRFQDHTLRHAYLPVTCARKHANSPSQ